MKFLPPLLIGILFWVCSTNVSAEKAHTYSRSLQLACAMDYRKLCAEYAVQSEGLRLCMDKAAQKLSDMCVNALVDAGEISKVDVARRKRTAR